MQIFIDNLPEEILYSINCEFNSYAIGVQDKTNIDFTHDYTDGEKRQFTSRAEMLKYINDKLKSYFDSQWNKYIVK